MSLQTVSLSHDLRLTFQIQANPRPHITLSRLPEWGVHQHHAPTSEETQILHGKKLQCFHTTLSDVMTPLGPFQILVVVFRVTMTST